MCRFSRTMAVLTVLTAGLLASCSRQDRKDEQAPVSQAEAPAEKAPPASPDPQEPPTDEPATPVEPEAEPPRSEPQDEPRGEAKPTEPPREERAEPTPREPEPRAEPEPREPDQVPASKPGSGAGQGQPCDGGRCTNGLTCVEYYGIAGPRGPKMSSCEIRCPGGKGCPAGQHCATVADGPGQVCRPH